MAGDTSTMLLGEGQLECLESPGVSGLTAGRGQVAGRLRAPPGRREITRSKPVDSESIEVQASPKEV